MKDPVYDFLAGVLGSDGAQALRRAAGREPALEPLLVPRAALAWVQQKHRYEGQIPGLPNSYLRFEKSQRGWSGVVSLPDDATYEFDAASVEHLGAAIGVAVGVDLSDRLQVQDRTLTRLGKSIDALVRAQEMVKKVLDPGQGYRLSHERIDLGDGKTVTHVYAHDRHGQEVGRVGFAHRGQDLLPGIVSVDPEHRRRGIASAMYAHAEKMTPGSKVVPSAAQTGEGEAMWRGNARQKQFGKVELPGQTHAPQQQQGPQAPEQPQKQPAGAARPRLPKISKIPGLRVEKSEASRVCTACGGHQFEADRFRGCICFRELNKSIKTVVYGDGYVLEFGSGIDREAVRALRRALQGEP